jgi:hypothetical protein
VFRYIKDSQCGLPIRQLYSNVLTQDGENVSLQLFRVFEVEGGLDVLVCALLSDTICSLFKDVLRRLR